MKWGTIADWILIAGAFLAYAITFGAWIMKVSARVDANAEAISQHRDRLKRGEERFDEIARDIGEIKVSAARIEEIVKRLEKAP